MYTREHKREVTLAKDESGESFEKVFEELKEKLIINKSR